MVTKAITAVDQELRLSGSIEYFSKIGVQITGTFTATFVVEGSNDDGTTWVTLGVVPWSLGAVVTSATAAGGWFVDSYGIGLVRIRCSAFTSGTPTIYACPVIG